MNEIEQMAAQAYEQHIRQIAEEEQERIQAARDTVMKHVPAPYNKFLSDNVSQPEHGLRVVSCPYAGVVITINIGDGHRVANGHVQYETSLRDGEFKKVFYAPGPALGYALELRDMRETYKRSQREYHERLADKGERATRLSRIIQSIKEKST